MERKVSRFWTTPATKRTHTKEWAERVEQQRREHWGSGLPAGHVGEKKDVSQRRREEAANETSKTVT